MKVLISPVSNHSLFFLGYAECSQGYGIAMNPSPSSGVQLPNMVKLAKHFRLISTQVSAQLFIFQLNKAQLTKVKPLLELHRGTISVCSLRGIKDIVLQSTQTPMPLYHIEWSFGNQRDHQKIGTYVQIEDVLDPNAVFMFCVPQTDELFGLLTAAPFCLKPNGSASVVSSGMDSDWKFVLTSDI